MKKLLRRLAVPSLLTLALFSPALVPVADQMTAQECADQSATGRDMRASADKVEQVGENKYRYTFNFAPASYHVEGGTVDMSGPWPSSGDIGGRTYRYEGYVTVEHEFSGGDCSGPDNFAFLARLTCYRTNESTGAVAVNLCNYDLRGALDVLTGGTFTATWGWRRFYEANSYNACVGSGTPHSVTDGTKLRAHIYGSVNFHYYPYSGGGDHTSSWRQMASSTVWVIGGNHGSEENFLSDGWHAVSSGTNIPGGPGYDTCEE